jgi:hypothetical protein
MGSGVAKAIREKYPLVWEVYSSTVGPPYTQKDSGRDLLGKVIYVQVSPKLFIANIVGQQFFGRDQKRYTSYDALDIGFADIARVNKDEQLKIHHPLIGCGLGGGDWGVVSAILKHRLGSTTLWSLPGSAEP